MFVNNVVTFGFDSLPKGFVLLEELRKEERDEKGVISFSRWYVLVGCHR